MKSYKFDPYVFLGLGYNSIGAFTAIRKDWPYNITEIPSKSRATLNLGLGFNYWFSKTWGMNLNLAAKWGISKTIPVGRDDGFYNNHSVPLFLLIAVVLVHPL